MTDPRPILATLALLVSIAVSPVLAQSGAGEAEIDALIRELGAEDHAVRERATARLAAIGLPALPALEVACDAADLEVAGRARRLVARLAWPGMEALRARLAEASGYTMQERTSDATRRVFGDSRFFEFSPPPVPETSSILPFGMTYRVDRGEDEPILFHHGGKPYDLHLDGARVGDADGVRALLAAIDDMGIFAGRGLRVGAVEETETGLKAVLRAGGYELDLALDLDDGVVTGNRCEYRQVER